MEINTQLVQHGKLFYGQTNEFFWLSMDKQKYLHETCLIAGSVDFSHVLELTVLICTFISLLQRVKSWWCFMDFDS